MIRPLVLVLLVAALAAPARAAVVAAPGYAVHSIDTPDTVQGGVVRRGDAILVGQGTFGAAKQQIIRLAGGVATTVATGFNSLGGFDLDAAGTLYVVDNGGELTGAATGDTVFAIPDALTRPDAVPAVGHEVLPKGSIPSAQDVLVVPGSALLVSDATGPGAGRVLRVAGGVATGLVTGLDFVAGLALSSGGTLYVGNVDGSFVGSVRRFALDGTPAGTLVDGLSGNFGDVLDADGNLLVSGGFTADSSSSTILAVAPDGTTSERAHGFGFSSDLFFDAARDETLALDFGVQAVTAICRDHDGDGVCDVDDDCPAVANPDQQDGDGDGLGDACDPCTGGPAIAHAKLTIARLRTPAGDDTIGFSGDVTLAFPFAPALDPVAKGVRVLVADGGGVRLDVPIPAGAYMRAAKSGWKVNRAGDTWTFRRKAGIQGVTQVTLKAIRRTPGLVRFAVVGKKGSFGVDPQRLPLAATLVLDAPNAATGQCGEARFGAAGCAFNARKGMVRCK